MVDYSNIFKVWGRRDRILLTDRTEIESEYGSIVLGEGESFEVRPPLKHRFFALEDSVMIECAYVEKGKIDPNDIDRESQGGRIVKGKEMTLDIMRKKGLLEL